MRRITLVLMSTMGVLVLLLSYRTSLGESGPSATQVLSSARIVTAPPTTAATGSGPDPRTSRAATSSSSTTSRAAPSAGRTPATSTSPTGQGRTTSAQQTSSSRLSTSMTSTAPPPATSTTPPPTTVESTPAPVTVQGASEMTRYGPVQVQLTIDANTITDVTALTYPHSSGRDQQINAEAVPALQNQVLSAQSANVQGVSGATYTTEGFLTSVQSALDAAGFRA